MINEVILHEEIIIIIMIQKYYNYHYYYYYYYIKINNNNTNNNNLGTGVSFLLEVGVSSFQQPLLLSLIKLCFSICTGVKQ